MKFMMKAYQPHFKARTAKNYKYFYRGQYNVMPDSDDIIQSMKSKKQKLQPYEVFLKKFQYKLALNAALEQKNPEVTMALIEELIQRGNGLEIALSNRSPDELKMVVEFIQWKVQDYRYQNVLVQMLRFVVDVYSGVIGKGMEPEIDQIVIVDLKGVLDNEVEVTQNLLQLKGQIDMVLKMQQMIAV